MTGTTDGTPQTARGVPMDVPDWLKLPAADRYLAATRKAAEVREARARSAGREAVALAHDLATWAKDPDRVPEAIRWNVRGEPRSRATFAGPHPDDFRGGLPTPRDYPG